MVEGKNIEEDVMRYLSLFCFILLTTVGWADGYFIPEEELAMIRVKPELVLNSYNAHRDELIQGLGFNFYDLTDEELFVVYCSFVSYGMAPFGKSNAITLDDMLQSQYLNSGNYPILTAKLAEVGMPGIFDSVHLPIVGFDGPSLLNYCFLFIIRSDHKDVIVDPTTCAVIRVNFDDFLSGRPIEADKIKRFNSRNVKKSFWKRLSDTLLNGKLRPSELLYYFHSVDGMIRNMPLGEGSATPRSQMLQFGPKNYW